MRILGAIVLAAWAWGALSPGLVRADDVDLEWSAPEACPSPESMRAGLEERVGRPMRLASRAAVGMVGVVEPTGQGYKLELRTRAGDASERRELYARSCNELARASLLVLSLLMVEGPAPPPTAAGATGAVSPQPHARRALRFTLRASVLADLGSLPRVALGPTLALGAWLWRWQVELAGDYFLAQTVPASSGGRRPGTLQVWAGSAGVCRALIEQPELGPCLGVELGRLVWRSEVAKPSYTSGTWLLGQIGLRLGLALGSGVYWHVDLGLGLPLNSVEIKSSELGRIYHTPSVLGRASTGLILRF